MKRRSRMVVVAALVISASSLPASAAPLLQPRAVADDTALASWMFPTGRPGISRCFFGGAYRNAVAGGKTVTIGFAVEGTCKLVDRGRATECNGTGTGGRIPQDAFRTDPALRTATLVVNDGTRRHRITWHSDDGPPSPYFHSEACPQGTGNGTGFVQHATAQGRIYGRQLGVEGVDHAIVTRGATLTECTRAFLGGVVRRVRAGQPVRVVFR